MNVIIILWHAYIIFDCDIFSTFLFRSDIRWQANNKISNISSAEVMTTVNCYNIFTDYYNKRDVCSYYYYYYNAPPPLYPPFVSYGHSPPTRPLALAPTWFVICIIYFVTLKNIIFGSRVFTTCYYTIIYFALRTFFYFILSVI